MGSSDEVMFSEDAGCSEATVEIKIKTLDSQTYTLRVDKCVPVPELKMQIQTVTGVVSEEQRLICRGKVLKDDQLLSAYHVEDGHTLHLVVRQPIPPSFESGSASAIGSDASLDHETDHGDHVSHSVVFRAYNIADQGEGGMPDINRIVSAVLSSIGITHGVSGSEGEPILERVERTDNPSHVSISTQPENDTGFQFNPLLGFQLPQVTPEHQQPLPPVIPDSLTVLSQYIRHLRHEFNATGLGESNNPGSVGVRGNEEASRPVLGQGLPTPASLAEVLSATRRILVEQVASCLSELSRQLETQASVATQALRSNIQTNAVRAGALLHNLGALLLELGRTTMMLQMGQIPTDAVVNAGPPIFISSAGPNPIMVQPLPFQPGMGFGATSTGTGSASSRIHPRNIDIRIRTGSSISSNNVNQGEQTAEPLNPVPLATARLSSARSFVQQAASIGASRRPSITIESGVRVVPVRTMVAAVPGSVGDTSSDLPGSTTRGMFFPILARVQHISPGQTNNAGGSQSSAPEQHVQSPPDIMQQQNFGSNSGVPVASAPGENVEATALTTAPHEGIIFSRILEQILPYVSQMSTVGQGTGSSSERADTSNSGSSQQSTQNEENQTNRRAPDRRDDLPQEEPDSKRQKKE